MARQRKKAFTHEEKELASDQIWQHGKALHYDTLGYTIKHLLASFYQCKPTENEYGNDDESESRAKGCLLIPDYHRNFVWDDENRSLFIESILLGFPVSAMLFCEREDGNIEIVDGVQRISALYAFASNQFALSKLKILTALEGFRFSDLSDSTRRKFEIRPLRVVMLDVSTSAELRAEAFNWVNGTGKHINPVEFRRGTFPGRFTDFIDA